MTKLPKDYEQLRVYHRGFATSLILSIGVALLLTGLFGCSTPAPVATNTPTVPTPTPTLTAADTPEATPGAVETPEATMEPLIPLDDDPVLGSPDAPVTMIEYSDYLCPFCRRFVLETMPRIEEEYIDTGKVKLVFRDFPLHGQPAVVAALVAECAAEQDNFWDMHILLFDRMEEWPQSQDLLATFQEYAEEIGIDQYELVNCLELGTPIEKIQEDFNLARQDGLTGTPAFFINETLVIGAYPFEEFQRVIEEELAKSG